MENSTSPAVMDSEKLPPFLQSAMLELWQTALAVAANSPSGAQSTSPGADLAKPGTEAPNKMVEMYKSMLEGERTVNLGLITRLSAKEESLKNLQREYAAKFDSLTASVRDKNKQVSLLEKSVRSLESACAAARQANEAANAEAEELRAQVAELEAALRGLKTSK